MSEQDTLNRMAYKGRKLPDNVDMLLHLGIEHDDMFDDIKMQRVNSIIDYFKQYDDGLAVLRRVAIKSNKSERIDRLWEYMNSRKRLEAEKGAYQEIKKDLETKEKAIADLTRDLESFE